MTLISRLEQAEAGSRELDAEIARSLGMCLHPNKVKTGAQSDIGYDCVDCGADSWGNRSRDGFNRRLGDAAPAYTTSIDAAMSLVPEGWMLSGLAETIDGKATSRIEKRFTLFQRKTFENGGQVVVDSERAEASTPALALCIASLKAAGHE